MHEAQVGARAAKICARIGVVRWPRRNVLRWPTASLVVEWHERVAVVGRHGLMMIAGDTAYLLDKHIPDHHCFTAGSDAVTENC